MRVLVTGGSGFIGQALVEALVKRGDEVVVLSRQPREDEANCRFVTSLQELPDSTVIDGVINLAGASLAARRWTQRYKQEIVASRMDTTRTVLEFLARLDKPPAVLLSASAIGYYGHHGDETVNESSPVTAGFAQQLCSDWEALAGKARDQGVRVCLLRLGVVLDQHGGALTEMAKSFRFGVASWLGSGRQWLSWVHRKDVVAAILLLLDRNDLEGPFNITAPEPVTGKQFCVALKAHHRTVLTAGVPGPLMRLMVGGMAQELLLNGQRVVPDNLQSAGFRFTYPDIEQALDAIY